MRKEKKVGTIIKEIRLQNGLSQKQLSDGICSEQHLYRIESSSRLPSGYLINLLNKKLDGKLINSLFSEDVIWE